MGSDGPTPVAEYALRLADDSLILGHRLSEWISNAPFLEEELAIANVALDLIGRSKLFYGYAGELFSNHKSEDDFAYLRDEHEFKNLLLMELPKGDFAFTITRQCFVDAFNVPFLQNLAQSRDETLAAIATKTVKESHYHLRRSREWVLRLGDGTQASHSRMQAGVEALWGYMPEFFAMDALEQELTDESIAVDRAELESEWRAEIAQLLADATLVVPSSTWAVRGGRTGHHTEHLGHLLTELQFLQRRYPGSQW